MATDLLAPTQRWWRAVSSSFRSEPLAALISAVLALISLAIVVLIAAVFVAWIGWYNIAATENHNSLFGWFLHFTMRNSVAAHTEAVPAQALTDPVLIAEGQAFSELRCSPCHGAPTRPADILAQHMLPGPPPIGELARQFTPDQLHWIIKHGVKMSAMPAWPTQARDDEIWAVVAFIKYLRDAPGSLHDDPQRVGLGGNATLNTCFTCHDSTGNGRHGIFPKLAGLSPEYIQQALKDFRASRRPSGFMQPFAAELSREDALKAANYFGRLDRKFDENAIAQKNDRAEQGARIAEMTLNTRLQPACNSCHVNAARSKGSAVPDLAGQPERYLVTQLKLFRSGARTGSPNAEIMASIARSLSDRDIENVSAYFASLRPSYALRPTSGANVY